GASAGAAGVSGAASTGGSGASAGGSASAGAAGVSGAASAGGSGASAGGSASAGAAGVSGATSAGTSGVSAGGSASAGAVGVSGTAGVGSSGVSAGVGASAAGVGVSGTAGVSSSGVSAGVGATTDSSPVSEGISVNSVLDSEAAAGSPRATGVRTTAYQKRSIGRAEHARAVPPAVSDGRAQSPAGIFGSEPDAGDIRSFTERAALLAARAAAEAARLASPPPGFLQDARRSMRAETTFNQGRALLEARKFREARDLLRETIILYPNHDQARALLAWSEYFVGDFGSAIITFKSALRRQP